MPRMTKEQRSFALRGKHRFVTAIPVTNNHLKINHTFSLKYPQGRTQIYDWPIGVEFPQPGEFIAIPPQIGQTGEAFVIGFHTGDFRTKKAPMAYGTVTGAQQQRARAEEYRAQHPGQRIPTQAKTDRGGCAVWFFLILTVLAALMGLMMGFTSSTSASTQLSTGLSAAAALAALPLIITVVLWLKNRADKRHRDRIRGFE